MGVYRLNMADENLINSVVEKDELVKHLPRMADFYSGIQEMKTLQAEISTLGQFTKKTGFVPGRNMQRVASIPHSIACAILEVDPDFWQDRKKVYRFLQQHPEYDTRTKIT